MTWLFGLKTANDEQDHQASEKLSCYVSHFQGDLRPFASIFVSVVMCWREKKLKFDFNAS